MEDHPLRTRRARRRGFVAALTVPMSVVLLTGSPAFASVHSSANQGTGTGSETASTWGQDYGNALQPHCTEVNASSYSEALAGTNSFNAGTGAGQKTYTGSATLTWSTNVTSYWANETGTYTVASHSLGCDVTTLGAGIASTVTFGGGDTTNGVACTPTNGLYERGAALVQNGMDIKVTFSGTCTVYQSGASASTSTGQTYSFTGTLQPICYGVSGCPPKYITGGQLLYDY